MKSFISKKLFVVLLATGLICFGVIPPDTWLWVVLVYLGAQGTIDFKSGVYNGKSN